MESGGIMSASFDDGDVWDASSLSLDMLSIGVGPVDLVSARTRSLVSA